MSYCKLTSYMLSACFCVFCITNSLNAAITDRATGQSFSDTQTVDVEGKQQKLSATGVSTRKKFFAKIYSVAHYMAEPPKGRGDAVFDQIINSNQPKQLEIKWVRSVNGKKIQEGYKESFNTVVNRSNKQKVQSDIDKFIAFFSRGTKNGDTHTLTWLPNGTIEVVINGNQVGAIKNKDFAQTLWSIWFGRKSVVNRNELISLIR